MQRDANDNEILGNYSEEEKQQYYKLIAETAILSVLVNNETDYCVFWSYSGHVDMVQLSIKQSKKRYNEELLLTEFQTYFEKHNTWDKDTSWKLMDLIKKKEFLKYILDFHEIPYEQATSEIITYTEEVWSF